MRIVTRDRGNGQYAHSSMDAACVCGHRLGEHTAAVVNGRRDCLECGCVKFRKTRKSTARLTESADPDARTCRGCGRTLRGLDLCCAPTNEDSGWGDAADYVESNDE
jgi:hypothetical protein